MRSASRTTTDDTAAVECQSLDSQAIGDFSRKIGHLDMPETLDVALESSRYPSSASLRLAPSQSYEKGGTKVDCERKMTLPHLTLPQTADSSKTDRHTKCAPRSSHAPSSPDGSNPNVRHVDGHGAGESIESNPRSGLESGRTPKEGGFTGKSPSPLLTRLSCTPYSTASFLAKDESNGEKNGETVSIRQILDFEHQVENMSPALPAPSRGQSVGLATAPKMRQCMRRVPQAATIVTATDVKDPHNPWRGATVSSFTTVTFEPEVIVSLNLKVPSSTFDAIRTSHCFDVNMLNPNEEGAKLASQFARGHAASPFRDPDSQASVSAWQRPKEVPQESPPVLSRVRGDLNPVAFRIPCTYIPEKTVQLGDHAVIFGIVKTVPDESYDRFVGPNNTCLAYVDGRYGQINPLSKQLPESPNSKNFKPNSQQIPRSGKVKLLSSKTKRTIYPGISVRVLPTAPADGSDVEENVLARRSGNGGVQISEAGKLAEGGWKRTYTHPLIRPGFVDYPPFRKISNVRIRMQKIDSNARVRMQKIDSSSQQIRHCEADDRQSHIINQIVSGIPIRKHYKLDVQPSTQPGYPNQPEINDSTAERSAEVGNLIKFLLFGSGLRIRKHLSMDRLDEQAKFLPLPRMSMALRQLMEKNLRRHTIKVLDLQEAEEESQLQEAQERTAQQHRKSGKVATREAMEKDIGDVMNEIDQYFKMRSKEEAVRIADHPEESTGPWDHQDAKHGVTLTSG